MSTSTETPLHEQSIEERRAASEEFRRNVEREKLARAERERIAHESSPDVRLVFLMERHVIPLLTDIRDELRAAPGRRKSSAVRRERKANAQLEPGRSQALWRENRKALPHQEAAALEARIYPERAPLSRVVLASGSFGYDPATTPR